MVKFGQVVLGPAGSGKSTYCAELQKYCNDSGRILHVVNLDPVRFFSQSCTFIYIYSSMFCLYA